MIKDNKNKNKSESPAVALGRLGGNAVVKKYGISHMSKLSKKAVESRLKKSKRAASKYADINNSRKTNNKTKTCKKQKKMI